MPLPHPNLVCCHVRSIECRGILLPSFASSCILKFGGVGNDVFGSVVLTSDFDRRKVKTLSYSERVNVFQQQIKASLGLEGRYTHSLPLHGTSGLAF